MKWETEVLRVYVAFGSQAFLTCDSCRELKGGKKPSDRLGHSSQESGQPWRVRFTTNRVDWRPGQRAVLSTAQAEVGPRVNAPCVPNSQPLPRVTASFHPSTKQWKLIRLSLNRTSFFAITYYFSKANSQFSGRGLLNYFTFSNI